ncbi:MAG: 50S ribosome-binding GTPase [Phycisphaeraceae bacterium]|nr:50S ribosome-binding GTPase [Phycisphaeraceae bacterium]
MTTGSDSAPAGQTIAAGASGPGRSVRAIIRLSGPGALDVLAALLVAPPAGCPGAAALAPGQLVRVALRPGVAAAAALPCLATVFHGPRSFTGEDSAELLLPGSPALVERVLAAILRQPGTRSALPGEFSARAYLSGKLTIDRAEGIAAGIAAQSSAQFDAARRMLDGTSGAQVRRWADEAANLLALVEAGIDFTDQDDVVPIRRDDLCARLARLRDELSRRLGPGAAWERAGERPRVVLFGPPNAGKSTLFNALLGRGRSVASPAAGTTRDALAETLDLGTDAPGSHAVTLIDLPGLDTHARGEVGAAMRDRALEEAARADVIIHCDPRGRFAETAPGPASRPVIRVRTMADLPGSKSQSGLRVCALDGWNLGPLRRAIADAAHAAPPDDAEAAVLPRHRRALAAAIDGLDAATAAATGDRASAELIAAGLRSALDALGEITGAVTPDDVLGRVFAVFCIGK